MNCAEMNPLIEAYFDGEVDLVRHLEIENHLKSCASCSERLEGLRRLRVTLQEAPLYDRAPESLRRWAVGKAAGKPAVVSPARWWLIGWAQPIATVALLVIVAGTPFFFTRVTAHRQADEIVAAHIRSLMVSHLTDVASSDQHTVKPWFSGKIDFAPAVRDFSEFEFPLVGGRLDYVAGRSAVALVYRHQQHLINLFIWPSTAKRDSGTETLVARGYNLSHWTNGGMTYWVISDLNSRELTRFSQIVQTQILPVDQ